MCGFAVGSPDIQLYCYEMLTLAAAPLRVVNLSPRSRCKTGHRCDSSIYLGYRIHNMHMAVWAVSAAVVGMIARP